MEEKMGVYINISNIKCKLKGIGKKFNTIILEKYKNK